jgi:hypothetical protein
MNSKESPEEEVKTLELCTNFAKQQVNDLERKLYASIQITSQDIYKIQKELVEFKKCVKNFKRHLVEAILLMTVSIVFIYALFFFYR